MLTGFWGREGAIAVSIYNVPSALLVVVVIVIHWWALLVGIDVIRLHLFNIRIDRLSSREVLQCIG